jgi:hypothetical protein
MTGMIPILALAALFLTPAVSLVPFAAELQINAVNRLPIARRVETIELRAIDLSALGEKDLDKIHVRDAAGKDLLCQAVDTDGDYSPDIVIFQSDFGPGEKKVFTVSAGSKWIYKKEDFKAYGRFARERFDDFAWENDRIAHRMYGKALETWVREPLTSSTVDIWSKRTPLPVINDWYMVDNYHTDTGTGADFYSAGPSRGCGGNGLWAEGRLWTSKNFVQSRVLANGPIRVLFELTYEPFDVNGTKVSEVKRISLDVGQNLDHFTSTYTVQANTAVMVCGIGLKKVAGEIKEFNQARGWLAKWEKVEKNAGNQGLAVVADPGILEGQAEDKLNALILAKVADAKRISYWAGFCWDKAGQFADFSAWKSYVDEFAQGRLSPIEVSNVAK